MFSSKLTLPNSLLARLHPFQIVVPVFLPYVVPLINSDRDRRRDRDLAQARRRRRRAPRARPLIGLEFRLACSRSTAITYRGAILSLHHPEFVLAATFTAAAGLVLQAALLSLYLALRDPKSAARTSPKRLAAVAVRRVYGRGGVGILVSGLRHRHRRQCPHFGAGRGAVRAGRDTFRLQAADDHARRFRHRAGGRGCRVIDFGGLGCILISEDWRATVGQRLR